MTNKTLASISKCENQLLGNILLLCNGFTKKDE